MAPQPPGGYVLEPQDESVKPPKGYVLEPYKDPITAATEKVAPWLGRAATEALPAIGSFAGPGGTLIGTGISQMMKRARPDLFGEQPQGADSLVNAGKELLLNNVLPAGLGKLGGLALKTDMQGIGATVATKLSNFPSVRNALTKNIADQAFSRLYQKEPLIEQGAANAGDTFTESPDLFSQNKIGQKLFNLNSEYTQQATDPIRTQGYNDIENLLFKDQINAGNAKIVAGENFTNDMAVNRLLTRHADSAAGTIDAKAILKEMGGTNKGIYDTLMNPASQESFKGLMTEMAGYEKKNITDRIINFTQGHLVWNLAGGAGLGALFGHPLEGAALGALKTAPIATDLMLRRIMQNPETVKLVRLALKTPLSAPEAPFLQKALTQVLPRIIQGESDLATVPKN